MRYTMIGIKCLRMRKYLMKADLIITKNKLLCHYPSDRSKRSNGFGNTDSLKRTEKLIFRFCAFGFLFRTLIYSFTVETWKKQLLLEKYG